MKNIPGNVAIRIRLTFANAQLKDVRHTSNSFGWIVNFNHDEKNAHFHDDCAAFKYNDLDDIPKSQKSAAVYIKNQ